MEMCITSMHPADSVDSFISPTERWNMTVKSWSGLELVSAKCPEAVREQKRTERRIKAEKIIREWIPDDCSEQVFIMALVDRLLAEDNMMVNITVKYADDTQLTIKETTNGNIRLTQKQGKKVENEI